METRSLEEIQEVLELAKLERCDVQPMAQCFTFSEDLGNDSFKLMELNPDMLATIKAGDSLVIRGDESDCAVICTNNKTYELKEAEISNSLLLIPTVMFPDQMENKEETLENRQVVSIMHDYLELRPCKPRLQKLRQLLEECPYKGILEDAEGQSGKKFTYSVLQDMVQCSNTELDAALKQLNACKIQEYWRVTDFEYLIKVLTNITNLCTENDWPIDRIPLQEVSQQLEDDGTFARVVVEHVLTSFGTPVNSDTDMETDAGPSFYKLDEDKMCRLYADMILRDTKKFNFQEFMDAWQQCVPEGMKTDEFQLQGLALIDRDSSPEIITYFPVENLPDEVDERFTKLFTQKEKWTKDEITPYINDLATEKIGVGSLLMKYARGSMQKGVKVFNSRKPLS
ncbi:unnamed protein product [Owenia fusiformis]|uniref:Sister chromatid cohesion protein DCC1 n=1 Tax=Owenia fusiformis TaxID=6347 RepID=A0A8S4N2I2_OWEFU|nr:unnamed protein product [Owenia fusiformis]